MATRTTRTTKPTSRRPARTGGARRPLPRGPGELPGARKAAVPGVPTAELATLVGDVPTGEDWLHEIKFDGYRILGRIQNKRARLLTRNGKDWTARLPDLAAALEALPLDSAVIDGEIVAFDEKGISDFQRLQNALGDHASGLVYQAFDLLHLDGWSLLAVPIEERKSLLASVLAHAKGSSGPIRFSDHFEGRGREFYSQACGHGLEGVVSKKKGSLYRPGRQREWLKTKCLRGQEFVIGGFSDPSGSRTGLGSLLLGYYEGKDLVYSGRVGTGFTEKSLVDLHRRLAALARSVSPFRNPPRERDVHWVEPKLVAEVEFLNWTQEGYLRHPTFRGLREDKRPAEVVREAPLGPVRAAAETAPDAEKAESDPRRVESSAKRSRSTSGSGARTRSVPIPRPFEPGTARGRGAGSRSARVSEGAARPGPAPDADLHGVRLTNPGRVLYPDVGVVKRDIALYYASVAPWMLPHVAGRPLMLRRCPEGVGKPCFYQKHASESLPAPVRAFEVPEEKGRAFHVGIEDAAGLISLVQMSALEIHLWGAKAARVERPVVMVFDLDPDPAVPWKRVVDTARALRKALEGLGLASFVMTTGGKGLHVTAPLTGDNTWDEIRGASQAIAEAFAGQAPSLYTSVMSKARRTGKIFIDYLRNARGSTAIAPWSTRARPGAPVAMPLRWEELGRVGAADQFTVKSVRIGSGRLGSDPWKDFHAQKQALGAKALRALGRSR